MAWFSFLVEHRGFEPLTPTLPVLCAPNCANAPRVYHTIFILPCQDFFSHLFKKIVGEIFQADAEDLHSFS